MLFRSHYGFDVFYCRPGVEGAHEKGGVEGEGGRFRRTHTVPMPKVDTLAELNAYLAKCDAKDDHRRVGQRTTLVADDFATEQVELGLRFARISLDSTDILMGGANATEYAARRGFLGVTGARQIVSPARSIDKMSTPGTAGRGTIPHRSITYANWPVPCC